MIDFLKRSFDRLPIPEEKRDVFNLPNTIYDAQDRGDPRAFRHSFSLRDRP